MTSCQLAKNEAIYHIWFYLYSVIVLFNKYSWISLTIASCSNEIPKQNKTEDGLCIVCFQVKACHPPKWNLSIVLDMNAA